MSIPLPISPKSDKLIWTLDSKGLFSVKSAYRISVDQEANPSQAEVPWKKLWKARLPERIKCSFGGLVTVLSPPMKICHADWSTLTPIAPYVRMVGSLVYICSLNAP